MAEGCKPHAIEGVRTEVFTVVKVAVGDHVGLQETCLGMASGFHVLFASCQDGFANLKVGAPFPWVGLEC